MQWVGTPPLAAAVALAGGLGMLTALTQPNPAALREAIRETRHIMGDKEGKFVLQLPSTRPVGNKADTQGVNITLLPSISPPD